MNNYICHCDVSANDGTGHISSRPTIYVVAANKIDAISEATRQLEDKYYELGCTYVNAKVSLLKQI